MEKVPEIAEPIPDVDMRAPLGVRVIAYVLLISGTCTLIDWVLDLWTGRGMRLDLGIGALLIGWGLLRRRDWARVCVVIFTSLAMVFGTLFVVVAAVGNTDNIQFDPAFNALGPFWKRTFAIAFSIVYVAIAWAIWRMSHSDRVCQWFKLPPIRPFIVWNPKRCRFGLGTLFYLTVVVAVATMNLMVHPGVREMQAQRWAEAQDLKDPLYFPNGAGRLPDVGQHIIRSIGRGDSIACVNAKVGTSLDLDGQPKLDYVVVESGPGDSLTSALSWRSTLSGEADTTRLQLPEMHAFTFQGDVQLVEITNVELRTSKMRVTLLEFWSYINHPDAEGTLAGLETYINNLRRRVAEREAKNTSQP